MFVFPKIHIPNMVFGNVGLWEVTRLRLGHEDGALMMELGPLYEEEDRAFSFSSHKWEVMKLHSEKAAIYSSFLWVPGTPAVIKLQRCLSVC